jgi:serine/threonine protein kinase
MDPESLLPPWLAGPVQTGPRNRGTVYVGTDARTGGPVAVKVYVGLAHYCSMSERVSALVAAWAGGWAGACREPKRRARLPLVVGEHSEEAPHLLVMEACGVDLQTLLNRERRAVVPFTAAWIMHQVAFAARVLHNLGFAHADIKLSNVLLAGPGARLTDRARVKLADYDGAWPLGKGRNPPAGTIGTPWFRPPELDVGGECTEACDAWSLGCLGYALIMRAAPFPHDRAEDRRAALPAARAALRLRETGHPLTDGLCSLIRRLLEPDPARRPAFVAILAETGALLDI